jgi:predicted HAD superfamily Cof-like phosphohydrolase
MRTKILPKWPTLLYVVYGAAVCYGLQDVLEDCFDEVQRSNISKADEDGEAILHADGKILKGENYSQPNLEAIISKKIENDSQSID